MADTKRLRYDSRDPNNFVVIDYTNWRGERRERVISPVDFFVGSNDYHKNPEYMVEAYDTEDWVLKTFPMSGMNGPWKPYNSGHPDEINSRGNQSS